jgi:hypothetical protein
MSFREPAHPSRAVLSPLTSPSGAGRNETSARTARPSRMPAFATLLACFTLQAALAQQDKPAGESPKVEVQILAIRATNANSEISSDLKDIAAQLREKFKFTGFKLEKRAKQTVELNKDYATPLIGSYSARVRPVRALEKNRIQVEIELLRKSGREEKSLQKTTVSMDAGRFLFFGGMKLGEGEELIAAVSAR